jgi:hypothetical protein
VKKKSEKVSQWVDEEDQEFMMNNFDGVNEIDILVML